MEHKQAADNTLIKDNGSASSKPAPVSVESMTH